MLAVGPPEGLPGDVGGTLKLPEEELEDDVDVVDDEDEVVDELEVDEDVVDEVVEVCEVDLCRVVLWVVEWWLVEVVDEFLGWVEVGLVERVLEGDTGGRVGDLLREDRLNIDVSLG